MTNAKNTKRALLASFMSLLLCFSMLLGTTFAWFTDSVDAGNHLIESGYLDIKLSHIGAQNDDWKEIVTGGNEALFVSADTTKNNGKIIWEPGASASESFLIENKGNLALKYQFRIKVVSATPISATNNKDLADILTLKILNKTTNEEEYLGLFGDGKIVEGKLEKGQNVEYAVSIAWNPSEADNEYNVKDGLKLEIGVDLLATQLNFETDGFDNEYDANLEIDTNGIYRTLDDGSTVFYYSEDSGFAGRVRLTELPENLGSEYVVPSEVNDLGGALVGVTLDKLTIPAGVKNAYKSLEGATIGEAIIEDGATTIPNRMFYKTNVSKVVIPSSVTVIEENAFALTAVVEELVIPASVTTVEEAAFQHMTALKTVTFEGNTAIQGYAFRGCAALRTVYLKGDDVTFIPSTLSNKNLCWFCNGESNNPNTSNITFYVENETVAARVKTAMDAEAGNTPVIINEKLFVSVKNATELQNALDSATQDTIISFAADVTGNVKVTQKDNVKIIINGNDKKFNGVMTVFGNGRKATAALTIKNINFVAATDASSCIVSPDRTVNNAYSYSSNVTVENCTFTDPDGVVNCAAVRHEDGGDSNWEIIDCVVDNTMHSLIQTNNVELEGLTIQGCEVYSKNGINLNQCAKVSIVECTIDVKGYAVRYGVAGATVNGTFEIKDSTLKSANDDGDAVIIFRGTMTGSTLTITNTTLVGTPDIAGNATVVHN